MKFEISDWVQGKTHNDELIHGYIETIDTMQGIVRVNVVKSDNDDVVGKRMILREQALKKLPENSPEEVEQIHSLIDLALSTWDEEWFNELTEQLKFIQQDDNKHYSRSGKANESELSTFI